MKTVLGYPELMRHRSDLAWDVHLMVRRPEEFVDHWWGVEQADRFFIHVESTDKFPVLAGHLHGHGRRIGAAVNPETPLNALEAVAGDADLAMFMTVIPGSQGRQFLPWVLANVRKFGSAHPRLPVAVDGGITPITAPGCVHSGAGILVSGSYILKSPDVAKAIQNIRDSVE
jgi:ribulose-phosphate 3-epimerase